VQVDPVAAVLIVDNDPDGSARGVVEAFDPGVVGVVGSDAVVVRYVHEPVPGIAAARNRALVEAGAADVLVFIDDDETPCAGWLARLVAQWRADGSAAVAGPVVSVFDSVEPDEWMLGTGLFSRPTYPSGTRIEWVGTGNLLLDLAQVRALGLSFDVRFGISGGSDSMFSAQLVRRGGVMTWCAEAEATELVPAARLTRQWVTQRSYRVGNSSVRVRYALNPGVVSATRIWADSHRRAIGRIRKGVLVVLQGRRTGNEKLLGYGAHQINSALGILAAAYGYTYREYRRSKRRDA
jgi:glycosyltransferase involved in cell wall biosynthesis